MSGEPVSMQEMQGNDVRRRAQGCKDVDQPELVFAKQMSEAHVRGGATAREDGLHISTLVNGSLA